MRIFPMIHHYQTAHDPFTPSEKLHFLQSAGWAENSPPCAISGPLERVK